MRVSLISLGILIAMTGAVYAAKADPGKASKAVNTLQVKVDGLSCPFCAHGLEKNLKKVEGSEGAKIFIDKGLAILSLNSSAAIDAHSVKKAVKKGGFTPGAIELTALGNVSSENKRWVFRLKGSESMFLLADNKKLEELKKAKLADKTIVVNGLIDSEHPKGHGKHPDILEILWFKALEGKKKQAKP